MSEESSITDRFWFWGVDARADLGDFVSLDPPLLHDLVMGGVRESLES